MILTDYYKFEQLSKTNSKLRIDCTQTTGQYNPLESLRNKEGNLFIYIGKNAYTKAGINGKSDLALSKSKHISSIYCPDVNSPYWYGDMKGTTDAMLFIENATFINGGITTGSTIEIFIARGQTKNKAQLFNLLQDGELDTEIEALRKISTKVM